MTVSDIIKNYLKENGYDGLCNPGDCACLISDLVPCDNDPSICEPGYKSECHGGEDCPLDGDCGFHISPNKSIVHSVAGNCSVKDGSHNKTN